MTPFFSIIIPVYNVAPYLRECLDSVLNQTYGDWEAICIDDGSTDGSSEILSEFVNQESRIRAFRQENSGVSKARNLGLSKATGDYILFLDADDVIRKDALGIVARYATAVPDADIISFKLNRFEKQEEVSWSKCVKETYSILDVCKEIPNVDLLQNFTTKAYKRSIIPIHGFRDYAHGEDLVFLAECMCVANKVCALSECLYAYRMRTGSATTNRIERRLFEDMRESIPVRLVCYRRVNKRIPIAEIRRLFDLITIDYVVAVFRGHYWNDNKLWNMWYDLAKNSALCGVGVLRGGQITELKFLSALHSKFLLMLMSFAHMVVRKAFRT